MKKILSIVLSLVISTGLLSGITVFATDIASGTEGNIEWAIDSNGVLTLSGTGTMIDYLEEEPLWLEHQEDVTSIIIENGITYVGAYAFFGFDNVTAVYLGASVDNIGDAAFNQCPVLESFYVDESNSFLTTVNGVLFNNDRTILFKYPQGKTGTHYSLPYTVTHIGDSAFSNCSNLTSVSFNENLEDIGDRAFYNCIKLRAASIPDSVTNIGEGAFNSCSALTLASFGSSLNTIEEYAFSNCHGLAQIEIPSSVEYIANSAFGNCTQLSNITVAEDNTVYSSVDGILFDKDKTTIIQYAIGKIDSSYTIPDTISAINDGAFAYSKYLATVNIPASVRYICPSAFSGCSRLSDIEIPDSVTEIGKSAFENCFALTDITLPASVTVINPSTFLWCENLKTITIPSTVTEIGTYAFFWCDKLTDVYYEGTEEEWNEVVVAENNSPLHSATMHFADDYVAVESLSLNVDSLTLRDGKSETLIATITPENATEKTVTWSSSDESVAVVDENGVVTAVSSGEATITASVVDGTFVSECTVHVIKLASSGPVISISHEKSREGKQIDVIVSINGNTGFSSLGIEIDYDTTAMTLVNVSENAETGAVFTTAETMDKKPFNMSWNSISNNTFNGTLATLTFEISNAAASGEYPISADFYKGAEGNYVDGEDVNFDENFESLALGYENGSITVSRHTPGDLNDDGKINEKDGTLLLRYLAGWTVPTLVEEALDINGDGSVDSNDAIHILRFLAGWEVDIY